MTGGAALRRLFTKNIRITLCTMGLLLLASYLRVAKMGGGPVGDAARIIAVAFFYLGEIIWWGVSLWRRLMHEQIRKYMLCIAGGMLLWVLFRTCKNTFFCSAPPWGRWLWYAYYIPMVLIPLFGFFTALYIGKPETWRPSWWVRLLYIPAALLIAGVLTNDLHQGAFSFLDEGYRYGPVYYAVVVWMLGMILLMLALLVMRCRLPGARRRAWIPLSVVGVGILYCVGYAIDSSNSGFGFIEMTAAYCALTAALWESCIATGLIPSNTDYRAFFRAATIDAQIVDTEGVVHFRAQGAQALSSALFQTLRREGKTACDADNVLHCEALPGGYVIWREALFEVHERLRALHLAEAELRDGAELLREELSEKSQALRIREKTRLYQNISVQTAGQCAQITQLLLQFDRANAQTRRMLLAQINVIGAYIKRWGNLFLLAENHRSLPIEEFTRCMEESIENLKLCGVHCAHSIRVEGVLPCEQIMLCYELFEAVAESVLHTAQTLLAALSNQGETLRFALNIEGAELGNYEAQAAAAAHMGGELIVRRGDDMPGVSLLLPVGGEAR